MMHMFVFSFLICKTRDDPRRVTIVHDHPKKPENHISLLSPLQNDKDLKMIKYLINNGSEHHRSADFLSGDGYEIRFSGFFE